MRRLVVLGLLVCLAAPTAAWAISRAPGDGTLAVRNGDGLLRLDIRDAVVIGKLEGGTLEILSAEISNCEDLNVWGADRGPFDRTRDADGVTRTRCVFREFPNTRTPEATRFRLVLQNATLLFRPGSTGISLSAIGRGQGFIRGAGGRDGVYSVNGEPFASLPDEGNRFFLAANATLR